MGQSIRKIKTVSFFCLMVFSLLILNIQKAQAACAPPRSASSSASKVASTLSRDASSMGGTLTSRIGRITTEFTASSQLLMQQISLALGGVATAASASGENIAKHLYKVGDAYHTKKVNLRLDFIAQEIARDNMIGTSDCIITTGRQYRGESKRLAEAAANAIAGDYLLAVDSAGSSLNISDAANTIEFQADLFRYMMANYCNPDMNGGLVPTAANPVQTGSRQVWCGMDRGAGDEWLMDFHLKAPAMLTSPSRLIDDPRAHEGVMVTMMLLLGLPMDKISLPSYDTQAGQAAFVERVRAQSKRNLPATYIARQFGNIMPTVGDQGTEWAREILHYTEGQGAHPSVTRYINANYGDNISYSQFIDAIVKYVTTGAQYSLDNKGLSKGQYRRAEKNSRDLLNYLQSERLYEARIRNLLLAAKLATN